MPSIFVSYRRTDAPGHAGRLYDRLVERFGEANVFKDLDSLEPGADFVDVIEDTVGRCDALVAVIGKDWLQANRGGERRLDDPDDWVRLEIANALTREIRVIPILVHGALMPSRADLPDELNGLARRHAIELTEGAWRAQVDQLLDALDKPLHRAPPSDQSSRMTPKPPITHESRSTNDRYTAPLRAGEWALAIDYGTTFTTAAVSEAGRGVELLDFDGERRIQSAVYLDDADGLLTGRHAADRMLLAPERFERSPRKHVGDRSSLILADTPVQVSDCVAAVLEVVVTDARGRHDGRDPSRVVLTYPPAWLQHQCAILVEAAGKVGLPSPILIPEPVAAAEHFARRSPKRIEPGQSIAIYDLGGETFDASVLRLADEGFHVLAVGGDESLGGSGFDDMLATMLGMTALTRDQWRNLSEPEDRRWKLANFFFRAEVRRAKERLSALATDVFYIPAPLGCDVHVTREQFEVLIRDDIDRTLDLLQDTIGRAGLEASDLAALYLAGGSSRIPLVTYLVTQRFGRAETIASPGEPVALGAAAYVAGRVHR